MNKSPGDPTVRVQARICPEQKWPFFTVHQRPSQASLALAVGRGEGGKQPEQPENTLPGPEFLP